MTQAPVLWLQQLEEALEITREIPLFGSPPPFPWAECSDRIATCLQLDGLHITHRDTHFLTSEALTSGFGSQPLITPIELTPLTGSAYWIMASEDVAKLTQLLLMPENAMKGWASQQFQSGFYRYLLLNCVEQIDQLKALGELSLKIGSTSALPQEGALCIDVAISHPKLTSWGRLVCPNGFYHSFKQYFSRHVPPLLSSALAQQVSLSLPIEIGQAHIEAELWEKRAVGDLLILDRCSYSPTTRKGTASITLREQVLFRVKIRETNLKIIDYAVYSEELPMTDEHIEEPDFIEDVESQPDESESHLWAPPSNGEASVEEKLSQVSPLLTLSVEVTRIQMPLEKLLQLKPGNTIELPVHPEEGIYLTHQGKRIAKGELVQCGDVLGVKILKLP